MAVPLRVKLGSCLGPADWPAEPQDTMKMGTYGIYEDEFRKVDGHWLISKRNVLNEFVKNRTSGPNNPVADMDALAEAAIGKK